jgi:hypothetical protein
MVAGAGVALVRQHDEPGGSELAQDAPDPGRGQVVHCAGKRTGDPQDLAVRAGDDLQVHPDRKSLAQRTVCVPGTRHQHRRRFHHDRQRNRRHLGNALNPDDSRLSGPVEVTRGSGGRIQLWTALDAAVSPNGQAARDAAAWFKIDATRQYVAQQGYVTARNANLLYPAIGAPRSGSPEMVFTITSATINPSAAYTRLGSGRITTVAAGTGPHVSFSDAPPFNSPRWGDYSFAQPDPDGYGVWLATEYIPPAADQDPWTTGEPT